MERQDDAWQSVLANVFSGEILRSMPVDIRTAGGWGVTETEWDEESSTWLVTYLAGEEYEETTLIFPSGPDISLADETYPYASFTKPRLVISSSVSVRAEGGVGDTIHLQTSAV